MCRFLMVKSILAVQPGAVLERFADMAESSRAPDGDWQGDGWGIAWLENNCVWQLKKSLRPIWEDKEEFSRIPAVSRFLVHARSASFAAHKDKLAYNQPFIHNPYAFVFNGLLKGVAFTHPVPGRVGAQKIWSLLIDLIAKLPAEESLPRLKLLLEKNSREIQALNIGLAAPDKFYAYSCFSAYPEYYRLQFFSSRSLTMLSSGKLKGYDFSPVLPDDVVVF